MSVDYSNVNKQIRLEKILEEFYRIEGYSDHRNLIDAEGAKMEDIGTTEMNEFVKHLRNQGFVICSAWPLAPQ